MNGNINPPRWMLSLLRAFCPEQLLEEIEGDLLQKFQRDSVAAPVAWYLMTQWTNGFAYHTDLPLWILVVSGASAIVIALLTIGFQSLRAAIDSPIKALKGD